MPFWGHSHPLLMSSRYFFFIHRYFWCRPHIVFGSFTHLSVVVHTPVGVIHTSFWCRPHTFWGHSHVFLVSSTYRFGVIHTSLWCRSHIVLGSFTHFSCVSTFRFWVVHTSFCCLHIPFLGHSHIFLVSSTHLLGHSHIFLVSQHSVFGSFTHLSGVSTCRFWVIHTSFWCRPHTFLGSPTPFCVINLGCDTNWNINESNKLNLIYHIYVGIYLVLIKQMYWLDFSS